MKSSIITLTLVLLSITAPHFNAQAQTLQEIKEIIPAGIEQLKALKKYYDNATTQHERDEWKTRVSLVDSEIRNLQVYCNFMELDTATATAKQLRIMAKQLLNNNFEKEAGEILWAGHVKGDAFCANRLGVVMASQGEYRLALFYFNKALSIMKSSPYLPALYNTAVMMLSPKYQSVWEMFSAKRKSQGREIAESYLRYANPAFDPLNPDMVQFTTPVLNFSPGEYLDVPKGLDENAWNKFKQGDHLQKLLPTSTSSR